MASRLLDTFDLRGCPRVALTAVDVPSAGDTPEVRPRVARAVTAGLVLGPLLAQAGLLRTGLMQEDFFSFRRDAIATI